MSSKTVEGIATLRPLVMYGQQKLMHQCLSGVFLSPWNACDAPGYFVGEEPSQGQARR